VSEAAPPTPCPLCEELAATYRELDAARQQVAQLTARLAQVEAREWQRYPLGRV